MSEERKPLLSVYTRVERTVEADGKYVHVRLYQVGDKPWSVNVSIDPSSIGGKADEVLERLNLLVGELKHAIRRIREVVKI